MNYVGCIWGFCLFLCIGVLPVSAQQESEILGQLKELQKKISIPSTVSSTSSKASVAIRLKACSNFPSRSWPSVPTSRWRPSTR